MSAIDLEHLLNLTCRMVETRALQPLLNYALNEAILFVGAERGHIVLLNDDGTLDFKTSRNIDSVEAAPNEDQISMSMLQEVIQTGEPLIVRNATDDTRWKQAKSVLTLNLRSVMCVPLVWNGKITGAIYVENRSIDNRFHANDLAPLILFARQVSMSIENARHYTFLQQEVKQRTQEFLAEAEERKRIEEENRQRTKDLERANEQLQIAWQAARDADRMKAQFLAHMSHELRTPLNAILNFTDFLRQGWYGPISEQQSDAVAKIMDSGEHLLALINDVLDMTRIDAGMMKLSREDISDLNEFMAPIIATAQTMIQNKPVTLLLDIDPNIPALVADKRRITQVLLNLLSNAAKFTEQGSITLAVKHRGSEVLFVVADTGPGISPDQQEAIFQPFKQTEDGLKRGGTGLGLPISAGLIAAHGGRLWVESESGEGAMFFATLPVKSEAPSITGAIDSDNAGER
jgi:signal transduction histidine kinase